MEIADLIKRPILYLVKKRWFLFGILPGVVILGIAFVISAGHVLMTYPGICLHCHVKQTRIMMWTQSIHPSQVTCVNCHAEPGQIFPHKFLARDDFVNKNCVNCHRDVEKKESQIHRDIKITHRLHIQEAELKCVDCHRNIIHEKMVPGTNRPSHEKMVPGTNRPSHATCIGCHEEVEKGKPEDCLKCHM